MDRLATGAAFRRSVRDTFRAAGYDKATTEQYVRTLRARIKELNRLRDAQLARRGNGR
jgi:hypothetical protein